MAREHCPQCGSGRVADGSIQSYELMPIEFRARKKLKWWHAGVIRNVQARLCVDCGAISLYADVSRLKVVKA